MRILIIIQARMGSTRLPGKVLKKLNGRALILRLIDNLKLSKYPLEIVVATSKNRDNDELVQVLDDKKIKYYRGCENDVLSRFISIIESENPDIVVRATADNPLMSAECMDRLIDEILSSDIDYVIMKNLPRGITTEVFKAAALMSLKDRPILTDRDREHVTMYLYEHPEQYKVKYLDAIPKYSVPDAELTIDTIDDFNKINKLYIQFGESITLEKVLDYLKNE